jgi:hypothetical protein
MFFIEPFRPVYFGAQTIVAVILRLTHLWPEAPSVGFVIVTWPLVGAIFNTAIICVGGALGQRLLGAGGSSGGRRGTTAGAVVTGGLLLFGNVIVFIIVRHYGFALFR